MITLYRFPYSCYALKVQLLLDTLSLPYVTKDVPFGDRTELVNITNGRVQVPTIVHQQPEGSGKVIVESREICRYLLTLQDNNLVPAGSEGLIWGYHDWIDNLLEDPLFKIVSPEIASAFEREADRAMFIFIKERKYGQGCVGRWAEQKPQLLAQIQGMLQDTLRSITHQGFIHGDSVTLADVALAGHLAMVEFAAPDLLSQIDPQIPGYMVRVRTR